MNARPDVGGLQDARDERIAQAIAAALVRAMRARGDVEESPQEARPAAGAAA